jgi:hypothetical protein
MPNRMGVAFTNVGDEDSGSEEGVALTTKGKGYLGPPCQKCGRDNHPTQKCHAKYQADGTLLHIEGRGESNDEVSSGHLQLQHMLTDSDMTKIMLLNNADRMRSKSSSRGGLPRSWILLDSQSTIDVFCNRKLLTEIHRVETYLHIRCNAGVKTTNMRGYLSGYGNV